jgi:hypothetical protein
MMSSRAASPSAVLALVWFCFFVVALSVPVVLLLTSSIEQATALPAIEQVSALYAPHLGAVIAFYFAAKSKTGARKRTNSGPFVAAILVTLVWNVLVGGALILVPLGRINIDDSLAFASGTGTKLAWLVAPALGYFFAKPGDHT